MTYASFPLQSQSCPIASYIHLSAYFRAVPEQSGCGVGLSNKGNGFGLPHLSGHRIPVPEGNKAVKQLIIPF